MHVNAEGFTPDKHHGTFYMSFLSACTDITKALVITIEDSCGARSPVGFFSIPANFLMRLLFYLTGGILSIILVDYFLIIIYNSDIFWPESSYP
jgi:hypothetical protein